MSRLNNSENITMDDVENISRGFGLCVTKKYVASLNTLLPLIEKLFKILMTTIEVDSKNKDNELNAMIVDSVEVGLPKNAAVLIKLLAANISADNFSDYVIHSLNEFKGKSKRQNAVLLLWCTFFCYLNIKRINSDSQYDGYPDFIL